MWSSPHCTYRYILLALLICALSANVEPLLIAYNNAIFHLGPNSSSVVVSADAPVVAFDIHFSWSQIFWATDFFIYRTPLYDLKTTTVIAATGRVSGGGLAVDWIHQVIYWTDVSKGRVESAHLDGKRRRVVCETNWTLGALAVDPRVGKLFWIESTINKERLLTTIKSSDTIGGDGEVLVSYDNIHPSGPLALDVEHWSLYFYRVNGNVSEQWELSYGGLRPPGGVKLFDQMEGPARSLALTQGGFFYSSEKGLFLSRWLKNVYSVVHGNITASYVVLEPSSFLIDRELSNVSQIRVLHNSSQPRSQDERDDFRCEHESVGPQGYECFCRYGFSLEEDMKSCFENGYVFFSTPTTFERIELDGKHHMMLFVDTDQDILAFDIHVKYGYVYWTDLQSQTIYRAPIDTPVRRVALIQNVSAYGLAVDWVHNHVYWADQSKIMVASGDGHHKMAVLSNLDSPADVAVDPINRYIFWTECGNSLSLKRAGLAGEDIRLLKVGLPCGTTITLDLRSRHVYWLDWLGTVHTSDYNGDNYMELFLDLANAIAFLNGRLLVFPIEHRETFIPDGQAFFSNDLLLKPTAVRIMKTSQQLSALNSCTEVDCVGLCIPSGNSTVPLCLCPGEDLTSEPCRTKDKTKSTGLLEIVSTSPFSVTLQCTGPLLNYLTLQPALQISEVESLANRTQSQRVPPWVVQVSDKHRPFTIDILNPATSYSIQLRNRVTRSSFSLDIHTPPPPLKVDRMTLISLRGPTPVPRWLPQDVHYFDPNPWDDLVFREYILLLISENEYHLSESPNIDPTTTKLIDDKIKNNYVVLKYYKSKEEFDDDPVMFLGNIPWGNTFWLAMVQKTEYKGVQHLDFVYTERFSLPYSSWTDLMEDILDEYEQYEIKD